MKKIGLCTHFTETDEWAFDFALELVRRQDWQLTICHWLNSPYSLRRDMVYPTLHDDGELQPISPRLLTELELELRQYYEPKLGDFTNVAFKLCEGMYQTELTRCFRQNLLDLVVIGYQRDAQMASSEQPLEYFAAQVGYPLVIVGPDEPNHFILNQAAQGWLNELRFADASWDGLELTVPAHK